MASSTPQPGEFRPPPGWPPPPPGWRPPPGWQPDPAWGPVPEGWDLVPAADVGTPGPPAPGAAASPEGSRSASQRRWLRTYRVATGLSLVFVLILLVGDDEPFPVSSYVGVGLGAVAAVAGTLMATHLHRVGVSDVAFAQATSGMRVIAVAWLLLVGTIVVTSVLDTGLGTRPATRQEEVVAANGALTGTLFGAAALFGVLGPGYTSYRSSLAEARRTDDEEEGQASGS